MKTTITEALAEIATIDKRVTKKVDDIVPYVVRSNAVRDPFLQDGGSDDYIARQRQSIDDLLERKIALREAIAKVNAETVLDIGGTSRTMADWLVWRRDVYNVEKSMLSSIMRRVQQARELARKEGVGISTQTSEKFSNDLVVCVDEQGVIERLDKLEEMYGRLDGALSLRNATSTVEV
jgi:hypothetical protein